ncbi:MAG: hypothetical protein KDD99_12405 [Bacteroidetes bacterium]|nr:hypothetical protein [Bacteroidota bacterium]
MPEEQKITSNKWIAILSYMTIIGWAVAMLVHLRTPNPSQVQVFHLRQSLGLILSIIIISFIISIPLLGMIVFLIGCFFFFLLWIVGLRSAIKGQFKEVPVFGEYYQKWFKSI